MSSFEGGVFHKSLERGRAKAAISIEAGEVCATTPDGIDFRVAYPGMQVELGGASGKVFFCRPADRSVTIFSEAPGFKEAVLAGAEGPERERIEQLLLQHRRKSLLGSGCLLAALLVLVLCVVGAPWLLRLMAGAAVSAVPESVDESIGEMGFESMQAELSELDNETVQAAMDSMLAHLEETYAKQQGYDWDFRVMVVDSEQVNAFALPGGQMVFYSGLLREARSAEEVAGVLAHEMGHVIARHGLKRIAQSVGVIVAIQLLIGDYGGLTALGAELLTVAAVNDYSREQEREADAISVELMHRSGLDPAAVSLFFERLETEGQSMPDYMEWLSTHPSHQDRIAAVRELTGHLPPVPERELAVDWDKVQEALASSAGSGQDRTGTSGAEGGSDTGATGDANEVEASDSKQAEPALP